MKTSLLSLALFLLASTAHAQHWSWVNTARVLNAEVSAVAVDSKGNSVVSGEYNHWAATGYHTYDPYLIGVDSQRVMIPTNGQYSGPFVVKYSPSGTILWAKTFGEGSGGIAPAVAVAPNDNVVAVVLVTEEMASDLARQGFKLAPGYCILTWSPDGKLLSASTAARGSVEVNAMAVSRSGMIYISGTLSGQPNRLFAFGETRFQVDTKSTDWVAAFESSGKLRWYNTVGNVDLPCCTQTFWGSRVAVDSSDNVYLAGSARSHTVIAPGRPLVGPSRMDEPIGSSIFRAYVVKYDRDGKVLWGSTIDTIGTRSQSVATDIAVNARGDIWVTGNFRVSLGTAKVSITTEGESLLFVARMATDGTLLWARGEQIASGISVAVDAGDNVYVVGRANMIGGLSDLPRVVAGDTLVSPFVSVIARYDRGGRFAWMKPAYSVEATDIALGRGGDISLVGSFNTIAAFDEKFIENYGITPFIASTAVASTKEDRPRRASDTASRPWSIACTPNPFPSTTTVRFTTTYRDNVRVEVHTIGGRPVAKLAEKEYDAGEHTLLFDPSTANLASGSYYVVLRGTNNGASRMVIYSK